MSALMLKSSKILSRVTRPILIHRKRLTKRSYIINTEDLTSRYGGKTNITVLPGVGIGPEITESTLKILEEAQAPLTYEILTISELGEEEAAEKEFENIMTSIKRNRVGLKANIEVKSRNPLVKSRNILLRKNLDLFVYVLSCKTLANLATRFGETDVIIIRQNTEGEYLMLEHEPAPGTIENLKVVTRHSSERVAKFAFDYAVKHKRHHITVVHSGTVQKDVEETFLGAALDISEEYPNIKVELMDAALAANKLVLTPQKFDIILASNLNGSILSNIAIGIVGGPGLTSGSNFGEKGRAVFEPGARNKGSSIVGKGLANPVAMISASINLLIHLGYNTTAAVLQKALHNTLVKDRIRTRDLGGNATTKEVTERVIFHVRHTLNPRDNQAAVRSHDSSWKKYCEVPEDPNPKK